MANQLLKKIPQSESVESITMVVDRCKSKKERELFNRYIRGGLETQFPAAADKIYISHDDSCANPGLQAADMFAWMMQHHKETECCRDYPGQEDKYLGKYWIAHFSDWVAERMEFFG
ncbi:MAG: DUF3800 domain-containing protein [Rickettsiales bacterium]